MLIEEMKRPFLSADDNGGGRSAEGDDDKAKEKDDKAKEGEKSKEGENAIDYEKLSSLIAGKQSVAEDAVLKGYFKQQGLSKEDAEKAIADFKEKKKAEQPNVDELNLQLSQAKQTALNAQLKAEVYKQADKLEISPSAIEYVFQIVDKEKCIENGAVSTDKLTEALKKVLEDVPQFKKSKAETKGVTVKVGSDGGTGDDGDEKTAQLRKAMGLK